MSSFQPPSKGRACISDVGFVSFELAAEGEESKVPSAVFFASRIPENRRSHEEQTLFGGRVNINQGHRASPVIPLVGRPVLLQQETRLTNKAFRRDSAASPMREGSDSQTAREARPSRRRTPCVTPALSTAPLPFQRRFQTSTKECKEVTTSGN